jgi:hypothetical protein
MTVGLVMRWANVMASSPLTPDPPVARRWADTELARTEYQRQRPGIVRRFLSWVLEHVDHLPAVQGSVSGPIVALVATVVVGLIVLAVWRAGGLRTDARRRARAVFTAGQSVLTAAQHRAAADAAVAVNDWGLAVLERFRAIARELEEQGYLSVAPGRTATEVAKDAAEELPVVRERLFTAASVLDRVQYGRRPAGEADQAGLAELDNMIRTGRFEVVGARVGR